MFTIPLDLVVYSDKVAKYTSLYLIFILIFEMSDPVLDTEHNSSTGIN